MKELAKQFIGKECIIYTVTGLDQGIQGTVNVISLVTPKAQVAYLYEDVTIRQGLEKLRAHGYTAVPVLDRQGGYVGTVSEGDFLWQLMGSAGDEDISLRSLEQLQIRDIVHRDHPAVSITVSMEELLSSAATQNFVPVVDDLGSFIGIVTRKDIICYFLDQQAALEPERAVLA